MKNALKNLSIRKKQAFAALCLAKFCAANHISHMTVRNLIEHLLDLLITDNLAVWEKKGAQLELTGRGDPLPKDLIVILPEKIRNVFSQLVENVVEVGIVDMYGALSDQPLHFLLKSIDIMQDNGVDPPSIGDIFEITSIKRAEGVSNCWGNPVSLEEYEKMLNIYMQLMT